MREFQACARARQPSCCSWAGSQQQMTPQPRLCHLQEVAERPEVDKARLQGASRSPSGCTRHPWAQNPQLTSPGAPQDIQGPRQLWQLPRLSQGPLGSDTQTASSGVELPVERLPSLPLMCPALCVSQAGSKNEHTEQKLVRTCRPVSVSSVEAQAPCRAPASS